MASIINKLFLFSNLHVQESHMHGSYVTVITNCQQVSTAIPQSLSEYKIYKALNINFLQCIVYFRDLTKIVELQSKLVGSL